jgi:hypothetical protein
MIRNSGGKVKLQELPAVFSLQELENATNSFEISKKLGEGGFGPVYRVNFLLYWSSIVS